MINFLRALDPNLYDAIQPYRVRDDALMPEEYRKGAREFHDDWFIGKSVRRMDCAYRVPLPFRVISGPFTEEWMIWDPSYPLSPGAIVEDRDTLSNSGVHRIPHVLTQRGGYGKIKYAAFINGSWRHVFTKYTGLWFGKRLSWYRGLHQDNHVSPPEIGRAGIRSDLCCWFPEVAASWIKES